MTFNQVVPGSIPGWFTNKSKKEDLLTGFPFFARRKVMKITVIIPSLNPDGKLVQVVNGLIDKGFEDIVLVNDGSDNAI